MVQLRYFASLRETLGVSDEAVALPEAVVTVAKQGAPPQEIRLRRSQNK